MGSGIKFKMNHQKSIEVILYLLSKNEGKGMNRYAILESIFAADKYHLNEYARPVTGDSYIKMEYGVVPSVIYDYLKNDSYLLSSIEDIDYPFHEDIKNRRNIIAIGRSYNDELLSESDIEALDYGFKEYGQLSFEDIKNKNHQEKCWLETQDNSKIDFALIIDDQEIIDDLKENSYSIVL